MKVVYAVFILGLLASAATTQAGSINVDDPALFKQAIDYLNTVNDADTMYLTVAGGIYTTTDTLEYEIVRPVTILATPGLDPKPIITHSDDSTSVIRMFHCYNSLTIEGCVIDGGHEQTHGIKHGITVRPHPDGIYNVQPGLNLTFRNCEFTGFIQDKEPVAEGHALYFYREIPTVGTVKFEDCLFRNIGDEAIRMSETEKYDTERVVDSLVVRNCTFDNIDAECVRMYSDTDDSTPDAAIIIENCTVYNSATEVIYLKNNSGALVRNIIVYNSRLSNRRPERNRFIIEVQKPGSHVSHIDTLNIVFNEIAKKDEVIRGTKGATEDPSTVWGFDPMMVDPANGDFTLKPASHAYYSGLNGVALGDLRWAVNVPTVIPFSVAVEGDGNVTLDPPQEGLVYDPGTVVTLTAVPDSGNSFTGWSGDLTGSDNPATVTVNASTAITATFQAGSSVAGRALPQEYALGQNYPNPFNPSTRIPFTMKKAGRATLEIYNLNGQRVTTVFDRFYQAGTFNAFFNAQGLAAAVYIYKLTAGDFVASKKLVLMK